MDCYHPHVTCVGFHPLICRGSYTYQVPWIRDSMNAIHHHQPSQPRLRNSCSASRATSASASASPSKMARFWKVNPPKKSKQLESPRVYDGWMMVEWWLNDDLWWFRTVYDDLWWCMMVQMLNLGKLLIFRVPKNTSTINSHRLSTHLNESDWRANPLGRHTKLRFPSGK